MMARNEAKARRKAPLATPTDLGSNAVQDLSGALTILLADMFALYVKTKNFHWHISGPHFRDYHLLLDEQAAQIFATTDEIAERVRKIGGTTLRSIGQIARLQRVLDNEADFVSAQDMLAELRSALAENMDYRVFMDTALSSLRFADIVVDTLKTSVFGAIVGIVACWLGYNVRGGTREVGQAAMQAVVLSSLLILVADVVVVRCARGRGAATPGEPDSWVASSELAIAAHGRDAIGEEADMARPLLRRAFMGGAAAVTSVVAFAAPAIACGGLVGENGTIQLVRTTTLAAYHDGIERYVTSFEFTGEGKEVGSIIPLPDAASNGSK